MKKKPDDEAFQVSFKFPRRGWDQSLANFNTFSSVETRICYSCYYISMTASYVICSCRKTLKLTQKAKTLISSRSQMFFEIGVLKSLVIITKKHLCWSLFLIKLQAWRRPLLLEKRHHHWCDDRILWRSLGIKLIFYIFLCAIGVFFGFFS